MTCLRNEANIAPVPLQIQRSDIPAVKQHLQNCSRAVAARCAEPPMIRSCLDCTLPLIPKSHNTSIVSVTLMEKPLNDVGLERPAEAGKSHMEGLSFTTAVGGKLTWPLVGS